MPSNFDPYNFKYIYAQKTIDYGWSKEKIFVAIAKLDPTMIGVGTSRSEAVRNMLKAIKYKYRERIGSDDRTLRAYESIDPDDEIGEIRAE